MAFHDVGTLRGIATCDSHRRPGHTNTGGATPGTYNTRNGRRDIVPSVVVDKTSRPYLLIRDIYRLYLGLIS